MKGMLENCDKLLQFAHGIGQIKTNVAVKDILEGRKKITVFRVGKLLGFVKLRLSFVVYIGDNFKKWHDFYSERQLRLVHNGKYIWNVV